MIAKVHTSDYYRDQQSWRDLQEFLPERLRLSRDLEPDEEHWLWRGNRIHLDRYPNPSAKAKVILHHGVGTNGRQMSLILGAPLALRGYETIALDNLGYGLTQIAPGYIPSYEDWVDLVVDFIAFEQQRDDRPIVLYGLSAGGMLAYHVAARAPRGTLRGIVGMTFLDQRNPLVRRETAHDIVTAMIGPPMMRALAPLFPAFRYPMSLASKMSALANNPHAMKVFSRDRTSAANFVSLRFLSSYTRYVPTVEPAEFDACPILLTQPAKDRWTPLALSEPVLSRITKVPVSTVMLENAGHYPMEDPGLEQLEDSVADFVERTTA